MVTAFPQFQDLEVQIAAEYPAVFQQHRSGIIWPCHRLGNGLSQSLGWTPLMEWTYQDYKKWRTKEWTEIELANRYRIWNIQLEYSLYQLCLWESRPASKVSQDIHWMLAKTAMKMYSATTGTSTAVVGPSRAVHRDNMCSRIICTVQEELHPHLMMLQDCSLQELLSTQIASPQRTWGYKTILRFRSDEKLHAALLTVRRHLKKKIVILHVWIGIHTDSSSSALCT